MPVPYVIRYELFKISQFEKFLTFLAQVFKLDHIIIVNDTHGTVIGGRFPMLVH